MLADFMSPAHAWAQIAAVMGFPLLLAAWIALKTGDDGTGLPEAKWWHDQTAHAARIDPGIALAQRAVASPDDRSRPEQPERVLPAVTTYG